MNSQLYDAIVAEIAALNYPLTIEPLQRRYPQVSALTLGSILSQERQRTRSAISRVADTSRNQAQHTLLERYARACDVDGGVTDGLLLRQAVDSGVSPALLARHVLTQYLDCMDSEFRRMGCSTERSDNSSGCGDNSSAQSETARRQLINNLLRNTHRLYERFAGLDASDAGDNSAKILRRIDRWRFADDLRRCVCVDPCCGVSAETIKQTIGVEYELRLMRLLRRAGVAFVDEAELRRRGYDKTPDILFEIPVAVEGCVVNWIDSKASFGDRQSHADYMRLQYVQYWRRYGPGLVIYWFGFLAELIGPSSEQHVLLKDHFPEESLVFMQPELAVAQSSTISARDRAGSSGGVVGGDSTTTTTTAGGGGGGGGEHDITPSSESGSSRLCGDGDGSEMHVRRSLVNDMMQLSVEEKSSESHNLSDSRNQADSSSKPC